jgi:hypothetical protein
MPWWCHWIQLLELLEVLLGVPGEVLLLGVPGEVLLLGVLEEVLLLGVREVLKVEVLNWWQGTSLMSLMP